MSCSKCEAIAQSPCDADADAAVTRRGWMRDPTRHVAQGVTGASWGLRRRLPMHAMRIRLLSTVWAVVIVAALSACASMTPQAMDGRFVQRTLELDGTAYSYQVFVPSLKAGGEVPAIVLFLHGIGERGHDNDKQLTAGLGPHVRAHSADFPAIVVFPQAPDDQYWTGATARMALAALAAATREFHGDPQRTYLTGLSMGGFGTWEVALLQPQRFAALVPISGALSLRREGQTFSVTPIAHETDPHAAVVARLRDVPIWIFHGARDDVVPPDDDRRLAAAFAAAGAKDARYTEFPGARHNAWDPAYAMPGLWTWLFAQHR